MEANKQAVMSCPSSDQLSAWYDSELTDATLETHINSCESCKRIVASYETIDTQLQETFEAATDRDTKTRIRTGSLEKIRTRDERERRRAIGIRLAAIAALTLTAVGLIVYLYRHSREQLLPTPGGNHANPGLVDNPDSPAADPDLSTAALLASAAGQNNREQMQLKLQAADGVHQVWSASDPAVPLRIVHDLLREPYRSDVAKLIAADSDSRSILLKVDKQQLQVLINHLDRNGCELLTAEGPQPGGSTAESRPDAKPVHYMADFVRR